MTSRKYSLCFKAVLPFLVCVLPFALRAQKRPPALYAPDDDGTVYTSLEAALPEAGRVYRLKLTRLPSRDSLPDELFTLTELRELTVRGCRLCTVNRDIGRLTNLRYLNLDRNRLVRLPEAIGRLDSLHTLIVSRNHIEVLPEAVGRLKRLRVIDAWDNPMYVLPESIAALSGTLITLDLRQVALRRSELEAMEALLPDTDILFTDICPCENRRGDD